VSDELLAQARQAAERAYAPHSQFRVGAAVRDADGRVFVGCNVESDSYGLTLCAERVAIFSAIAAGATRQFQALAVVCLDGSTETCVPCGACRQIMAEHLAPDAPVSFGSEVVTVRELLPRPFRL
jgi:cytidine deaminase